METDFYRVGLLPPYVLAEVNRMKAKARAEGRDIIDLGMGNPDSPPPPHVIQKLIETAKNPDVHGYSLSRGIPGLRKAQCAYYKRRFNVDLDPETEIITTMGSKEGLANLATAITRPGDVIMVPSPSYPIHPYGFVIAGGSICYLPRFTGQKLIDQISDAVANTSPRPKVLILNYPCNPTTETVTLDFYEEIVDFCRYHEIYILSDLAYCEIYFDGNPPPSVLQVKGAKDITVEFTSLSKTYSMAGWRVGFAAGNKNLIYALGRIKSYLDYGSFTPVQVAATTAINGPQDCIEEYRQIYKSRSDILVKGLNEAGWNIEPTKSTMFTWTPIPKEFNHMGALEFSKLMLEEANVAVAPGTGFGKEGEGYLRIGMVENKHRMRQAMRNIKQFMRKHGVQTTDNTDSKESVE
ncbi:MAG: LL-diaminopimelate aminotransferase [Alphaproteobacteria bacterium]|nr:LL-diaminopimelate aminotransferase [Alphaproteobacteria bacterium]